MKSLNLQIPNEKPPRSTGRFCVLYLETSQKKNGPEFPERGELRAVLITAAAGHSRKYFRMNRTARTYISGLMFFSLALPDRRLMTT